ncbi:MAG: hypothetical protein PHQ91_15390 [Thermoanaerobaculaceae bacterium]|nr:hypothetical protein [Thermoanaerobaculaceae bacterium]
MSFRTTAVITAVVTLVLGAGYLFAGTLLVGRWQIEPTESVLLFGRRIGALYLGLSVIFFLARSAPVSAARTALATGTATACSLLAFLGVYEFSAGRVRAATLASAVVEGFLALGYIRVLVAERRVAAGG